MSTNAARQTAAAEANPRAVDVLLAQLEAEGVTHLFGVPGGNLVPLYEALKDRGTIVPVLCKQEDGGAFMADGYARVSGRLGVCSGIAGPGATNALTGIAGSYADSVPVLLLSGQVATSVVGRGAMQDATTFGIDLVDILRPVTKLSTMLVNPETTQRIVAHAVRAATAGRPGPVHLNLPGDVAKVRLAGAMPEVTSVRAPAHPVDAGAVARAVSLLARAKSPAILAGNGVNVSQAWAELRSLAESAGIPVATTPKAKGALPETHPLSLGVFGFGGHLRASRYLTGEVDVLLVVGSSLGEIATNGWDKGFAPTEALVQVDIDPLELGKNFPVQVGVVGDARAALAAIEAQLATVHRARPGTLPAHLLEVPRYIDEGRMADESVPLKPQRVLATLRRVLPDDALLFSDIGNCVSWVQQYFDARQPHTVFQNLGLSAMGWSIPASIGGQLAAPDRTVAAVLGDGAFAMTGMEVHTAVEYDLPIVFVVLNDSGFGMVEHGELLIGGRVNSPTRYRHRIDAAGIARSLGARGLTVESPAELEETFADAVHRRMPTVIDVHIDPDEIPGALKIRARSLARMFESNNDDR